MTYLYKSTTGRTINIGNHIVTGTGVSYSIKYPELNVEGIELVVLDENHEPIAVKPPAVKQVAPTVKPIVA